jgi:hypothetical protein
VLRHNDRETALHLLATCSVTQRILEKLLNEAQLPADLVPAYETFKLQDWLVSTQLALPSLSPPNLRSPQLNARVGPRSGSSLGGPSGKSETLDRVFHNTTSALNRIHSNIIDECSSPGGNHVFSSHRFIVVLPLIVVSVELGCSDQSPPVGPTYRRVV